MEIASRAAMRGHITKLAKTTSEYLDSLQIPEDAEGLEDIEEELSVLLERLSAANDNLQKGNEAVRPLIKEEDFEAEARVTAEYSDKAISAIARLKSRLRKVKKVQERLGAASPHNGDDTVIEATPSRERITRVHTTKLQKLQLRKFSGDFKCWIPFWEQFRTMVHENSSLSAIDKFNYLEAALTGQAAESISGFTPSESCYESAIALLKEEYGHPGKIIDNTMQGLLALKPITNRSDANGLRKLYNSVVAATRSLKNLGIASSNYFVMLKGVLLRCLPIELRVEFYRYADDNDAGEESHSKKNESGESDSVSVVTASSTLSCVSDQAVNSLLKFLKREVESLEKATESKPTVSPPKNSLKPIKTAVGLFTGAADNCCFFCKSPDHGVTECHSSKSLNERKALLRQDGRCLRCCKRGHYSKNCKTKSLSCKRCKNRHATSLCDPSYMPKSLPRNDKCDKTNTSPANEDVTPKNTLNLYAAAQKSNNVYLQTARVFATGDCSSKSKTLLVRAIIDGGSQLSFIRESLSRKLNLPKVGVCSLSVIPFGSTAQNSSKTYNRVRVTLVSQHDDNAKIQLEALEVPDICADVIPPPKASYVLCAQMKLADSHVEFNDIEGGISVLIGADAYWEVVTGTVQRLSKSLAAVETIFGWTLQGASVDNSLTVSGDRVASLSVCACEENAAKFWDLEILGISCNEKGDCGSDIDIKRINGRYSVSLPWKNNSAELRDNKDLALSRLFTLVRRLNRDGKLEQYDAGMREMIENGFAEKVLDDSIGDRVCYLPHRAVYRDDKETTKMRIVFDASARAPNNLSLNDCLEVGENFLPDILKILLRFRCGPIALTADIEKAFLQVLLNPADRNSHRFLWFSEKVRSSSEFPAIASFRMTRVTFGVTCSPFLLGITIRKIIQDSKELYPEGARKIEESLYMDDLILSCKDESEAVRIYKEARAIFESGSMNLRKWASNDERVRLQINASDSQIKKVLGQLWCLSSDEMLVDLESLKNEIESCSSSLTKRKVLKLISKVFDPLGILGPWVVRLKIIFQDLWRKNYNWDEELPIDMKKFISKWCCNIEELEVLAIPRCILSAQEETRRELHVFADASPQAYGVVAFLRQIFPDGEIIIRFICSKNRVAPLKSNHSNELTLPKLELTACLLAARLFAYLRKNLDLIIDKGFLWTDSKIALFWIINSKRRNAPYIDNRVKEIRLLSNIDAWNHCPGLENPADLVTRGLRADDLSKSILWWNGPIWLKEDISAWPVVVPEEEPEILSLVVEQQSENSPENESLLFDPERYSSWKRLLRVTAFTLRAAMKFKRQPSLVDGLTAEEILQATNYWIRKIQGQFFANEIKLLRQGKDLPSNSRILTLNPILDKESGLLKVGSRLQFLAAEKNVIQPIILPKCYVSKLIITDMHERLFHSGAAAVLTRLRDKFWIVRGRQLARSIIKACYLCKVLRGKSMSQPFAPIPRDRIHLSRPFEVTGMDFAGPLYIAEEAKRRKVYILLFTCAAVRAVHLEVTRDLTTESCLQAIRRFIARRGAPSAVYSDNATTFKKAAIEIRRLSEQFGDFFTDKGIRWKFIVERAPWWGGFWERLVGLTKNALKAAVGRSTLNYDQLHTLVTEVENVLNSRPLTYYSEDPLDLSPLTPAHFLNYRQHNNEEKDQSHSLNAKDLRKAWKERLSAISTFKRRWYKEYVLHLRTLHHNNSRNSSDLSVGDVVLLQDPALPRTLWHLALVEEIFPGRDHRIRACQIKLANGSKLRRPVQLLYPLEIASAFGRPEDIEN